MSVYIVYVGAYTAQREHLIPWSWSYKQSWTIHSGTEDWIQVLWKSSSTLNYWAKMDFLLFCFFQDSKMCIYNRVTNV